MFERKLRWLRHGDRLINLDSVICFETNQLHQKNAVSVFFNGSETLCILNDITLDDIHCLLKHGRPQKRKTQRRVGITWVTRLLTSLRNKYHAKEEAPIKR